MTTFIIVQLQDYNRIMINTEDIKTIEEHGNGCIIQLVDDEEIESITNFDTLLKAMTTQAIRLSDN